MIQRQKPARPRSGNVAIEAALVLSLCAVLLAGMVEVGQALRRWYQLSALTDHVGQMVARSEHPSGPFIQTILSTEQALPVLARDGAVLQVGIVRVLAGASGINVVARYDTGAGGRCVPHDPAVALPALSGVVGVFVVVQGCMPAQGSRVVGGGVLPTLYSSSVFALEFPMHAGDVKAP